MLHKAPKLLAAAAGLFVVGVLVITASDRFGDNPLQGDLSSSGMMSSSMDTVVYEDGPWMDPNNDMAPVDLESFLFSDESKSEAGGTTGDIAMMGAAPTAPPATPAVDACAPKAEKKLSGKEVCKCGQKADDLEAAYKTVMEKALKNVKAPQCAAKCPQDDSISPNPKLTVNGPTITRTHVAGKGVKPNEDKKWKSARCKLPQLVACFTATGDATSERFCKKSSSSSSSTPPPPPPDSSSFPSSGFKCCARNTPDASCIIAGSSCPIGTSDGMTYGSSNCSDTCNRTTSTSSSSM